MRYKKVVALIVAVLMSVTAVTSCGTSINKNEQIDTDTESDSGLQGDAVTELSSGTSSSTDSQGDSNTSETVTYTETNFDAIEVPYVEYKKTYQAESGTMIGDTVSVSVDRASFKGDGYVTGANPDNWSLSFDLPESQFYNITVQTASDNALNSRLYVNGKEVWVFRTDSVGDFEEKNLENIWLEEGVNEITIKSTNDAVDIDYITIEANEDISSLNPDLSSASLSNENATYQAKALYSILCSNYGKQILTAQHETAGENTATELTSSLTDKYPAIRVSDIGGYTKGNPKDITKAVEYYEEGGLIAYDWYWIDPSGDKNSDKFEVSEVSFDITKAMPEKVTVTTSTDDYSSDLDEDQQSAGSQAAEIATTTEELKYPIEEMAMWTTEEIENYHDSGEISDECYQILSDIDTISSKLMKLKEKKIPVLWRPLPVASNGLYWWGTDKEAYKWLWQLMYTRMTEYHELNNLVWVWSAQNADWYVGDEYCDVLSVDVYTDGNRDAQINTLLFLNNICKTKPLAMSECGNLPAMESVLQEKAYWSYTALWTEPYFSEEAGLDDSDDAGSLQARFKEYYNNNYTITREELPNISDVAKSIKKQEKAAAKEAKKSKSNSSSDTDSSSDTSSEN